MVKESKSLYNEKYNSEYQFGKMMWISKVICIA